MEGMGPSTYDMAKYASTFNRETLEVDVEFNDNQSEIDMREMEQDLGLDDDSVVVNAREIQNEVVIEMADARTLELFKGGKGDSMVASGGASRRTGFKGSVGASTVNPECPIRKKEEQKDCFSTAVLV